MIRTGHIKDSMLIDFNSKDFGEKLKQLDKSKTYLVHCAVGGRSAKACTSRQSRLPQSRPTSKAASWLGNAHGKPVEK